MKLLDIGEYRLSKKATLLMILGIFVFSVACRMIWVYQFSDMDSFKWNNELMINTNDGYYFAEGARDILNNDLTDSRSPTDTFVSKLTAFLTKILPFSLETVILYMPAFLSSLLVIPMVLIGRTLGNTYLGGIAALLSSITWSYYNRTMVGYYDTDMLNIVFPMFIILGFMLSIKHQHIKYTLISIISIILYQYWYSASYSLILALVGIFAIYILFKDRKNRLNFLFIALLLFSMASIPILLKVLLISGIYLATYYLKDKILAYSLYILAIAFLLVLFTGGFNPILTNLKLYVFREAVASDLENLKLHYFAVTQTVREAGQIPFEVFANRISGHTITFILSLIGYVLLLIRYPIMILTLPMVGLGFIALKAGLRFTVYAVPIMAFGFSYFVLVSSKIFESFIYNETTLKYIKGIFISIAILYALYPNIKHIEQYKVPTVFNKQEVKVLDKLGQIAKKDDYVVTWWDYGYPIRFYSNVNTLIDGGLHSGDLNFPVSFILTKDQVSAANMARLDVEYTERREKEHFSSNLIQEMKDYKFNDINQFLNSLHSKNFKLPEKTRDIYLYLPDRMLNIFPTVNLFSNLDLVTGKRLPQNFFYKTQRFRDLGNIIDLGNGIKIIKNGGKIQIGRQVLMLNSFIVTEYDRSGKLQKHIQNIDPTSPIYVIFMKSYNRFLVLDKKMFNSTYIQLYVLENYDKDLYEPIILSPFAKVYKLKI
ncbi:STT3 domain-containing protein [Hydrogenimonas thermophila]|uniref:STT3 domain-containing protein n=1 Tax=Hydrogenimonas thermophila TaxID=223786 RepID=UPI002936E529|nr:STT3 domain-containing protein [Hydrogenimonas thermophila]WOE70115.1 STT3 domain-containing protein [Hydrogenimonas thermophila]WOE72632.1 STT3 domain-containing protein [Hydrogenimonas thermophila]